MSRSAFARALTAAAVTAAVAGGCNSGANVETKTEADATQLVNQRAEQVVTLIGGTTLEDPRASAASCEGKLGESSDAVFFTQGTWMMKIPQAKQAEVISRLRDSWRAENYEITTDVGSGERGSLTGKDPAGWSINVSSTQSPEHMRLLIHTPCFRSPTPR